ncbi:helix-turn-helix domain-containing protein [Alkalibaculum sp. M08DMB]|uniref:Helix-turn-helix domain-containing protein n=1 Tax=Alkalibaculum sporogenes TaxID=2655001 RepID=A0A6A7K8L3_9FIRM|nr:AraC family transcriptional regulator [Alkalibaculum sporogenes]MPW25443.1 helix-turn-helix domain-containing protein [Alkalibaculum sporogenes]
MTAQEQRLVSYDNDLKIEALQFNGIMQKFPNHFHEHYVIGFVESGKRYMTCKNKDYTINTGDLLLFNPLDNHACHQIDNKPLDWRSINIKQDIMRETVKQITGIDYIPNFTTTVAYQSEALLPMRELHGLIMDHRKDFKKEENFLFLIEQLISQYTEPTQDSLSEVSGEIQKACTYIETHFTELISLDDLSKLSNLNKYTLLRNFTKQRGITPYQYLETIRIGEAKKLLEKGIYPLDAAIQTGFADQSHFTKFFKNIIGLTPKQYGDIFKENKD